MNQDDFDKSSSTTTANNLFDLFREKQTHQNESPKSINVSEDSSVDTLDPTETQGISEQESGKMPPDARRALVTLLRQGVILAGQKSKQFDLIRRYQDPVRQYLNDIFLKLVLDERMGVAFVAGLDETDEESEEAISLITRRTLSLYDTLLLLILRKHFQERETTGEQRIVIDIEHIEANLSPFLPLTNSSRSDRRKLSAALKKMGEKHILSVVRGSEDRFEITPIIRYVINAAFLEQMLEDYLRLAKEADISLQPGEIDE